MKKWLISIMILIAIGVGVYQWQTKPLTTNDEIHAALADEGLLHMTKDGLLQVKGTYREINATKQAFTAYLANIEQINIAVRQGMMTFDKHYKVKVITPQQAAENAFQQGLKK